MPKSAVARRNMIHHLEHVMGTVVIFDVCIEGGLESAEGVAGIRRAVAILHRADAVFSTWKDDSAINQLRRGEIGAAQAPPEVFEVLEACESARDLSRGWFDPWAMPGGVDPTGFVKGWAAQRALDELRTTPATSAIVNAAGDIATFGRNEAGAPFRIGIVDPYSPQTLACVVEVCGAIATSGTYERGEHLIDPHSGLRRSRTASASVVGPDLGSADAFATALAVAGEDGLGFIEALDGYQALAISSDGARHWTEGFPFA